MSGYKKLYAAAKWFGRAEHGRDKPSLAFFRSMRKSLASSIRESGFTPNPTTVDIQKMTKPEWENPRWAMRLKSKEPLVAA